VALFENDMDNNLRKSKVGNPENPLPPFQVGKLKNKRVIGGTEKKSLPFD